MHALTIVLALQPHLDPSHHVHHRFTGPHVDYIGVGFASALSWIAVAGPGEAALIAAAIAAARHRVDLPSVILVAWFGAAVGGAAGWLLGRRFGRALMTARGPLLDRRLRMLRRGDELYTQHGLIAVYFAPSWMAGINDMGAVRFLAANSVTAAFWAVSIGLGAYWVGPSIADVLSDIGLIGLIVVGVLVALTLATRRWSRRRLERTNAKRRGPRERVEARRVVQPGLLGHVGAVGNGPAGRRDAPLGRAGEAARVFQVEVAHVSGDDLRPQGPDRDERPGAPHGQGQHGESVTRDQRGRVGAHVNRQLVARVAAVSEEEARE